MSPIPYNTQRPALEWYYSLPTNFVDSFEMLCTRFMAKFANSKPTSASLASFQHVVQRDNKSLRQYMAQFTKATLSILDLDPAVTIHAFLVGLKRSPFLDSLYVDPPLNMDKLWAKATRYISIEENADARKRKFQPHTTGENSRFQKKLRLGRYDCYTPLNATREAMLQKACNFELIHLPLPGRPQPGVDSILRCIYHQNIGHNTNECTRVRDLIE